MSPQRSLSFLAASTLCWSVARSCGVLVHNEVLHRATHLFALPNSQPDLSQLQKLISPLLLSPSNAPSVQAGAFFPDWGYQCLSTDDDAEAAHWPPFLVASVEHIVSKYGFLNDTVSRSSEEQEHLEGLISFIFAISGHQTQDATWHAIRFPTGFLAALAGIDFDGDETKAHRVLDFGGDFVMATRLARMEDVSRAWIKDEWRVPIKDLIAIYARVGRDVKSIVLRYCTMRGLAALRSGLAVGPSLYNSMASQSPMLLTSLDDYYLGGIDDMTARTISCWSNLTRWFAHGIDRDEKLRNGWGICDVFRAIKARGGAGNSLDSPPPIPHPHDPWGTGPLLQRSEKEFTNIQIHIDKFGAETYTLPPLEAHSAPVPQTPPPRNILSKTKAPKFKDPIYIATYTPYSHFGASLSTGAFSPSGPALAVSAPLETEDSARPGEGTVYVLLLSDILSGSVTSALQPEYVSPLQLATPLRAGGGGGGHTMTDQRFGTASTAWNTLDMTFLAVAAPGPYTYDPSTPPSLPFQGHSQAGRIDLFKPGQPSRFLSFSIKGAELGSIGRRWWGETMISADLDGSGSGFLVVGGSRSDNGRVCEGRTKTQFGEGEIAVFQLVTSEGGSTTAAHIEIELEHGGKATTETAGITMNTWSVLLPPGEKVETPCAKTATYEGFGRALAFMSGSRTLLVGAPGVGKVFAYRFWEGAFTSVFTIVSSAPPTTLRTGFGGGGIATGSVGGKEWVVVGAADEDVDGDLQAGVVRVYVLDGDEPQLIAEVVAAPEEEVVGGGRKFGKFGRTIVGDGAEGVWVGSEFWDGERGGVWWVDVEGIIAGSVAAERSGQQVLGAVTVGRFEVETYAKGEEANGRFATSLAVGVGGELFVGIPYSGVAREEQEMRFYGAVAAFKK